jgi:NADPH-dependent 2,4-dienoyl-CoA reductase/sulfur reductase-like enzyme
VGLFHLEEIGDRDRCARSVHAEERRRARGGPGRRRLVGVRPQRLALARVQAGLAIRPAASRVDAQLQTTDAGESLRAATIRPLAPNPHSGAAIRVEHWVVAERQGQTAALNMLGRRQRFDTVPFFWSQHYDVPINYVGHAEAWDEIAVDGDIGSRDCIVRYKSSGRVLAVASIYRDVESLEAEAAMELGSGPR